MTRPFTDQIRPALKAMAALATATTAFLVGLTLLTGLTWAIDSGKLPDFAIATLLLLAVGSVMAAAVAFLLRRVIGRGPHLVAAACALCLLTGMILPLAWTYRDSCTAIGWHYEKKSDLMVPTIIWNSDWECRRVGPYREFAGVWTYGERSQPFEPSPGQADTPPGYLRIDEAAANLLFDRLSSKRPSRYTENRFYIRFMGNALTQGRSRKPDEPPTYEVRDVLDLKPLPNR